MIDPGQSLQTIVGQSINGISFTPGQLMESLPIALYTCDKDGYITQYNAAAAKMWGREPVIGTDLWSGAWKIYSSDGTPMPLEYCPMAMALKEGKPVTGREIIIERTDGSRVWVSPHPVPLFDSEGNIIGAVNMLTDITSQKTDQQKLAAISSIIENSDDAIISKNLSGIVTSWNASAQRIFGYTPEEMIGQHIMKLIPTDRQEEEPKILERLKRGERVDHFETQRVTKDGRLVDLSLTISPVKNEEGVVIGASKIARDITAQKQQEKSANESEERFKMAVASTGLGTWEFNPISGDLNWSDECRKIYDIGNDEKIDFELFGKLLHPEDAAMAQAAVAKAMDPAGDGSYDIQFRILRYSDKKVRWIRSQGKVYFNDQKQADRFIGTVLDITDEKMKHEALSELIMLRTEELHNANSDLARTNNELEQFAYVASHDLQEPLRKIQTFADRLHIKGKDTLSTELVGYIDRIVNSADKMSILIRNLLNYARIGRMSQEFIPVNLNEIVTSVLDDLDVVVSQKEATINYNNLPTITALPLQMGQLFYNLINNSLKFSAEGRKPVIDINSCIVPADEIKTLKLDDTLAYYKLNFTDNGIGFNPEYAERIFTIFQRLNSKELYPGTGIGLALCKKVTDNHSGHISAKGEAGKGSTFTIVLPAEQ